MSRDQQTTKIQWDRFSILAEIKRRGMSLSGIAKDAGLNEGAGRQGLHGNSLIGAEAIAAALEIPFRHLFPREKDYYPTWERRTAQRNHNESANESALSGEVVDGAERAA